MLLTYLQAVAVATVCLAIQSATWAWLNGFASSVPSVIERLEQLFFVEFVLMLFSFFLILITAAIPYLVAYLIARHFAFRSVLYWLLAWVFIAAILAIVAVWIRPESGYDSQPTFYEEIQFMFVKFLFPSFCAALVCWFSGRSGRTFPRQA